MNFEVKLHALQIYLKAKNISSPAGFEPAHAERI
jgi:hypothetical protein